MKEKIRDRQKNSSYPEIRVKRVQVNGFQLYLYQEYVIWTIRSIFNRTRMDNPVTVAPHYWYVADRDWIELPCLSINCNQFGHTKITLDFTHIFAIKHISLL